MSVEENLLVGLSISGAAHGRLRTRVQYFPILKERRRQAAGTLSGGQQQQLAIGRVLVGEPTCCCSTSLPKASSRRSCRTLRASSSN